jgi:hypothetical protein
MKKAANKNIAAKHYAQNQRHRQIGGVRLYGSFFYNFQD